MRMMITEIAAFVISDPITGGGAEKLERGSVEGVAIFPFVAF